jgi:hypothetical protein
MKNIILMTVLTLVTQASFSFVDISCKSKTGYIQKISLGIEEVSDLTEDSVILVVNGKKVKTSSIVDKSSDYGLLKLKISNGTGAGKTNYTFDNLGSSKCLGVYESQQKGLATVQVTNSMGLIATLNCSCIED